MKKQREKEKQNEKEWKKKGRTTKKEESNNIINNNIININLKNKNIITNGNNEKKSKNCPKKEDIKKFESIMDYTEEETNDLSYDLALKNDKRTYWQYYISLIRTKHEILYAFFNNKDYTVNFVVVRH